MNQSEALQLSQSIIIETAIRSAMDELAAVRKEIQALVTLANLVGNQDLAHTLSKDLCAVMSLEFKLKEIL